MKNKLIPPIFLTLIFFLLSGCGDNQTEAVQPVEEYFQAILEKDETLLLENVCPSYEFDALLDFNTFAIVETTMENFQCQVVGVGQTANSAQVNCQGTIKARFGEEIRSFDLSKRTFSVVDQNGSWQICGHVDEE